MVPRILIVDDDDAIRELIRRSLLSEGYERVAEAQDGRTAIDMVFAFRPTLILLDIRMPDMDGRAFMEAYRTLPFTPCPIIAISADNGKGQLGEGWPIAAYLDKPFNLDELRACVDKCLNLPS